MAVLAAVASVAAVFSLAVATARADVPQPVAGGGSFNNAPVLPPGTYSDTIFGNEYLYYAVDLDAGQQLTVVARATYDSPSAGVAFLVGDAYDSFRSRLDYRASEVFARPGIAVEFHGKVVDPARQGTDFSAPGRYYVELGLYSPSTGAQEHEFPLSITVEVAGTPASTTTTTTRARGGQAAPTRSRASANRHRSSGPALAAVGAAGLVVGWMFSVARSRRTRARPAS
jgi:Ca-activated chloride channel family protein